MCRRPQRSLACPALLYARCVRQEGVRLTHAKRRTPARTSSPPCCGRGPRAVSSPRDASLGATAVVWSALYCFQSVSQTAREALASRCSDLRLLAIVGVLGLWWRLSSGPIELDLATPWLKAAIEENFGGNHSVVVGGTQLERDEKGRTSLRLRDIVVRDADGTIVASAPKAEVGLSGRRSDRRPAACPESQSCRSGNGRPYRNRWAADRFCRSRQAADRDRHGKQQYFFRRSAGLLPPIRRAPCVQSSRSSQASWRGSTRSGRPDSTATICVSWV